MRGFRREANFSPRQAETALLGLAMERTIMGSTPLNAATLAAASRGVLALVRLPLAVRAAASCVFAMFAAPMQIAPKAT
jgi:hypothetical protein